MKTTGILILLFSLSILQISGQRPGNMEIDSKMQGAILDSIIVEISKTYVIKETADKMVGCLRHQIQSGYYLKFTDLEAFIRQISLDCKSVYNDQHFDIQVIPKSADEKDNEVAEKKQLEMMKLFFREINYGFRKIEVLPGNIGYLKLDCFPSLSDAASVANATMSYFENVDALIIDLRENGGGYPGMVRLIMSYLFEGRRHFINNYQREGNYLVQSWTLDFVPGKRLPDVLVYVLTSHSTCSAAEAFTFGIKGLNRGVIIGETTSGGGHTFKEKYIDFHDFMIGMHIPNTRAYDPITNEGFEGIGIVPHVEASATDALDIAHMAAIDSLSTLVKSELHLNKLTRAKEIILNKKAPN